MCKNCVFKLIKTDGGTLDTRDFPCWLARLASINTRYSDKENQIETSVVVIIVVIKYKPVSTITRLQ